MFDWIRGKLGVPKPPQGTPDLVRVDRAEVRHLFVDREGLPQVDWGFADLWITTKQGAHMSPPALRRAICAAWLEELRDALDEDHQAWRAEDVEGLTPMKGRMGPTLQRVVQKSMRVLRESLTPIRGSIPISPFALVAISPLESYVSFTSHFMPDEGEWGTSGGCYIAARQDGFPVLAINAGSVSAREETVAHELTHHALVDCHLPLWAEEGITQMMEERVVGTSNFALTRERKNRHRERWTEDALDEFIGGSAFSSAEEDHQELAYHLSQWVVRRALDERREVFFKFLRACRTADQDTAAHEHLGVSPADFVREMAGLPAE